PRPSKCGGGSRDCGSCTGRDIPTASSQHTAPPGQARSCSISPSPMKCSSAKSVKCSTTAKNRATAPRAPGSLNSPEAACGPTKKGEDGNMEKLLIVDDDAALRRLMRLELSDTYEVIDS